MSLICNTKLLAEAAGIKVTMTSLSENENTSINNTRRIVVTLKNINQVLKIQGQSCGFHLTKSKWDPYPWVGHVEKGSVADSAGLRDGDCLLKVDDKDLLDLKITEIASLIRDKDYECDVNLFVWRYNQKRKQDEMGLALIGPLPEVATRLANAVSGVVHLLECPICLDSATSPVSQCVHGHILCAKCRSKTSRCPVCRVRLGQGRCLFADKLHKVFYDMFDVKNDHRDDSNREIPNLHDRLFGKKNKKDKTTTKSTSSKPRQLLLTRLLFGNIEKAVSAEDLTMASKTLCTVKVNKTDLSTTLNEGLRSYDRMKSASTGELSSEIKHQINNNSMRTSERNSKVSNIRSMLSLPQTPVWGGSTNSMSYLQLVCPLSRRNGCKEVGAPNTLLEHLSRVHPGPQIHFYGRNAKIPFPFPFYPEAIYLLHYDEDIFFLECEEEIAWMACITSGSHVWGWKLYSWDKDGTKTVVQRNVLNLEDEIILTSQHIGLLPKTLSLQTIAIQLLCCESDVELNL